MYGCVCTTHVDIVYVFNKAWVGSDICSSCKKAITYVQWNLLRILENVDTCIIWTPSYGPK